MASEIKQLKAELSDARDEAEASKLKMLRTEVTREEVNRMREQVNGSLCLLSSCNVFPLAM